MRPSDYDNDEQVQMLYTHRGISYWVTHPQGKDSFWLVRVRPFGSLDQDTFGPYERKYQAIEAGKFVIDGFFENLAPVVG